MTTFADNAGNILQHAPLCAAVAELPDVLCERLLLIDAHAMAPIAIATKDPKPEFENFRRSLRVARSKYAKAWTSLVDAPNQYPSTAKFVSRLWGEPRDGVV